MASKLSKPSTVSPPINESQWVVQISETLTKKDEDFVEAVSVSATISPSIYKVPMTLLSSKPEAYTPQLFAFGPYHQWDSKLYEMEPRKLVAAKKIEKQLQRLNLEQLVDDFTNHEHKIRAHYRRYLDFAGKTLAWVMVIDASFLLDFLQNFSDMDDKDDKRDHILHSPRMTLSYNSILKDAVMLENQIPLFLLRKILDFGSSLPQAADNKLSNMLIGFLKEVSPFKDIEKFPYIDVVNPLHLLGFIYSMIVPKIEVSYEVASAEIATNASESKNDEKIGDPSYVKQLLDSIAKSASGLNIGLVRQVKKALNIRPVRLVFKLPWKIISILPGFSMLKGRVESFFLQQDGASIKTGDPNASNKQPLLEEIMIPSATQLTQAGVKFSPTKKGLEGIKFDVTNATLYLPVISLDINTEVLLRNMVAYEASVEWAPMVFTRYTELITGIVDTEEDVMILSGSGIIKNQLKSNSIAATLWNGMSKSVRLSKVPFIDRAIDDVNKYYNSRWRVKSQKMLRKYILSSWQLLTLLTALLLLFLNCVEALCSVYSCGNLVSFKV